MATATLERPTKERIPVPPLRELVLMSEKQLAQFDIAEVHWKCAEGLPGTDKLDIPACLAKLDRCAELVRKETKKLRPHYHADPERFDRCKNLFRAIVLCEVVKEHFNVNIDLKQNDLKPEESFKNPERYFMHGLIEKRMGMCLPVSVLIASVGRRLGYPLKLVLTTEHMFVRWEGKQRFNIECSIEGHGSENPPDSHYMEWPKQLTEKEASRYGFLQSMTPRRELSCFLFHRGLCLALAEVEKREVPDGVRNVLWAHSITPDDPGPISIAMQLMHGWRIGLQVNTPVWFPEIRINFPSYRKFPNLPRKIEQEFIRLDIVTKVMREHFDGSGAAIGQKLAELPDRIFVDCQ